MDSSEVVMQSIQDAGGEYVFGLPGSVIMNTIDKLTDMEMEFVSTRHEQVATSMADGYARVSSKPGISLAHVGPGSANQIIGVAAAYRDASPVIAISGNEDLNRLGRNIWHEWDVQGVFERFTKWNKRITRGEDASRITRQALVKSLAGRPGPVHLDLPKDVSRETAPYPESDAAFYDQEDLTYPLVRPSPDRSTVRQTVKLLTEAEQPLILAGGGCVRSGVRAQLKRLIDRLQIPVVTSNSGRGIIPETHPLALGVAGKRGTDAANVAVEMSDLILGVGARFSALTTKNWDLIDRNTTLVQVDIHPEEFASQYPVDITTMADVGSYLEVLEEELVNAGVRDILTESETSDLKEAMEQERREFFDYSETEEIGPQQFYAVLKDERDEDAIITAGGGVHSSFAKSMPSPHAFALLQTISYGSMGFGFPLAMGAKLAAPEKQVICVEGDGGFAMVMQDLETAKRYDIDVKLLIYNNFSYGTQKLRQKRFFGERYLGTDVGNPRFDEIAEAFGIYSSRVERPGNLRASIREILDHDGPALLDVIVDPWEWPETESIAQI